VGAPGNPERGLLLSAAAAHNLLQGRGGVGSPAASRKAWQEKRKEWTGAELVPDVPMHNLNRDGDVSGVSSPTATHVK
jgi:hypothetical protein